MDWEGLKTAYLDRERARLGLPSRRDLEDARLKREQEAALAASNLETAATTQEFNRARIAAMPAEQDLERRLREAQIRNYDEQPQTRVPPSSELERLMALPPEQQAKAVALYRQMHPQPAGGGGTIRLINTVDEQNNPVQRAVRLTEGQTFKPGMTAEQRNVEYQAGAVEPAFTLVRQSLDNFKAAAEGGLPGAPSALIPGTDAYYAKSRFVDQAKALLGAIVARQAGEGSRLSDEDRVAYSQAASLVNGALLLPGGIEEATKRIDEAEKLINDVTTRRRAVSGGMLPAGSHPTAPAAGGVKVQRNKRTGEVRHSLDGGATWQPGPPPQ